MMEVNSIDDFENIDIDLQSHNSSTSSSNDSNSVEGGKWSAGLIALSIFLFLLAGIFEIGGGYLFWLALKKKQQPYIFIPVGAVILILYGIIPTFQPVDSFGRTFAVYGGFFIGLSYLWGVIFDGMKMDLGDYIGASVAIAGVCVAWFWPR
jgi:small multidrug resistance family-3 protein